MRKRVVYTAGVFDMLHNGHLDILEMSKRLGDILVVGVVSDAGCEAYKGKRPLEPEHVRLRKIRSLRMVDLAVMQDTTDPTPVLLKLRPDVMTHGSDWERLREGQETLERLGIEWVLLPYGVGPSSSDLKARLADELRREAKITGGAGA